MSLHLFLLLLVGGAATGFIGALLGLGGGVFLIPFLVLALGVPMHTAIATSIVAVIATSSAGAIMNLRRGVVNVRLGMLLETFTVTGAICGGITANILSGGTLTLIFSTMLVLVSGLMLWNRNRAEILLNETDTGVLGGSFHDSLTKEEVKYSVKKVPFSMFISLIAGNVSGLLGVGGGVFKVPAMYLVSGVPMKAATATSNFMIGVTAAASAFIYFSYGHLNPLVASAAGLGVLAGSMLGIRVAHKIHSRTLTLIFSVILILVAVQLFLKGLK
jgi:uncharacterized membrane protein YfcA